MLGIIFGANLQQNRNIQMQVKQIEYCHDSYIDYRGLHDYQVRCPNWPQNKFTRVSAQKFQNFKQLAEELEIDMVNIGAPDEKPIEKQIYI